MHSLFRVLSRALHYRTYKGKDRQNGNRTRDTDRPLNEFYGPFNGGRQGARMIQT